MSTEYFLGVISGTSVDGLDLAIIAVTNDQIDVCQADTITLPETLTAKLRKLANPSADELDQLGHTDAELGGFIGHAINEFMSRENAKHIRAIGSHGQTVRHRPTGQHPFTMQIGDPNRIAEITGITTVADFRRRDMAAGGQGAPLVPPFHKALFGSNKAKRVVLNIGGISNISILAEPTTGFDTGPGNCLMDEWILAHRGQPYDEGGSWAASGNVNTELLDQCLADPYFELDPPKSTGREYFHRAWLAEFQLDQLKPEDVQATLAELTARCTIDALLGTDYEEIIVCGGGRHNKHLMWRLADLSSAVVTNCDSLGVDGDAIEAAAFAWLAHRTIEGLSGNEPAVTGASDYRILGAVYPA